MVPAGMPELRESDDIKYLLDVLNLETSDDVTGNLFMEEVDKALNSKTKLADNIAHILAHR